MQKPQTMDDLIALLSQPLPPSLLAQKPGMKDKRTGRAGPDMDYIPWHTAVQILSKYATCWDWDIQSISTVTSGTAQQTETDLFLVGRLTLWAGDQSSTRSASGTESVTYCTSYGDPSSNAESMAFRRCCAKFGLGLYLYEKRGSAVVSLPPLATHPAPRSLEPGSPERLALFNELGSIKAESPEGLRDLITMVCGRFITRSAMTTQQMREIVQVANQQKLQASFDANA